MKKKRIVVLLLLLNTFLIYSQNWMLKLSSKVELRAWRLTSTAEKSEKALGGASIGLYKGTTLISQTTSTPDGDFEIDVPGGGDYILSISYAGCNTKKFYVSTNGVDESVGNANYKPTVSISGFIMSKPLKGVDYIGLNEPLVKVEYKAKGQNFDKDQAVTNNGLTILSKIYDAETSLIEKFCAANKAGDEAMKKHNCPLAKDYYDKAINMLPGEQYPLDQITKAELCIKNKKAEAEAAALAVQQKAAETKIANEKIAAEKVEKDKAQFNKTNSDKLAKEKTASPKETKDKAETDKIKINDTETSSTESSGKKGHSNHSIAQPIGKDIYKETITKADDYFKMKRYREAKTQYEEALKIKNEDVYAKNKLFEISKFLESK